MVDKIIELFVKEPERSHSGEDLSRVSGISRQAVWKKIQNLRKEGWEIEGKPGKGYRLVNSPTHVEFIKLPEILQAPDFWEEIYILEKTGSTNDFLLKKGEEGVLSAIALADTQWEGRGRMGRPWFSTPGKNLNISFLLPLRVPPGDISPITLVAGITVARAIERVTGVSCRLKWPNDIYLDGKKLCGILTEVVAEIDLVRFAVLGIGINVNSQKVDFPPELRESVISLKDYLGRDIIRVDLAALVSDGIAENMKMFEGSGFLGFADEWNSLSYLDGKNIAVDVGLDTFRGRVLGVGRKNGHLMIEVDDGGVKEIISGDIRVLGDSG